MSKHLLWFLLLAGISSAWLAGWNYMTPVNISNTGSALTDYQVQASPQIYNTTGLVGSWHFSEGTGTRATDSSGNRKDGTIYGGTNCAANGKHGKGCLFGSTSDYIEVPASPNWAFGTGNFTIEFWMNRTGYNGPLGNKHVLGTYPGGTASWDLADWKIIILSTNNKLKFWVGDYYAGMQVITTNATINTGEWYHIAVVRNGTGTNQTAIYVNGALDSVGTISNNIANRYNLYLARPISYSGEESITGTLDEIRIYNRSLPAQEISDLYTATKARLDYADLRFTQLYSVYETPVTVSGTGSALTDYQVLLNITNQTILSHMRADGADLRFFSSASSAPYSSAGLAYWIESINSTQAKVWVKANISSGGSTIYMYYGNVSAGAQSNGTATFLFFDDFNRADGAIGGGWTQAGGVVTVSGNKALFTDSPSQDAWAYNPASGAVNGIVVDSDFQLITAAEKYGGALVRASSTGNWYSDGYGWVIGNNVNLNIYDNGAVKTSIAKSLTLDTWHNTEMRIAQDNSMEVRIWLKTEPRPSAPTISYGAFTPASAGTNVKLNGAGNYNANHAYFDNYRIRKYSATEPSATTGAETIKISGETALYHWLESDKSAWVKVPSVPAGSSPINMYHGNASATYNNSLGGTNTLLFFDDFNDNIISDYTQAGSQYTASGGMVTSASGYDSLLKSFTYPAYPFIVEVDIKPVAGPDNPHWLMLTTGTSEIYGGFSGYSSEYLIWNDDPHYTGAGSSIVSAWRKLGLMVSSSKMELYDSYKGTSPVHSWTAAPITTPFKIGIYEQTSAGGLWDNLRARKYAIPEPTTGTGVEQQTDTTAPSVQIQSPSNQSYNISMVQVNFTATDNTAISSCTVRLNGTINSSTCSNYTVTLANGAYALNVTASDASGNTDSSQVLFTVAVVTDTAPPVISIQSPANLTYTTGAIAVSFTASDDTAVSACTVRLNGTVNSTICGNYSLVLGNGAYTLNITANDTFGNLNSSAVSFTVSILPSVSNSTTTNSNGIGNVSLNGIPPGASRVVYSIGSSSYSRSFSISTGVTSVRILAKATLQGTPAPGKTLTFQAS